MKDALAVAASIFAGAAVAIAFHGYWIGAWLGLALLAFGVMTPTYSLLALASSYLGGLLFHLLAFGWMRCALSNVEALAAAHYFALGWALVALIGRRLRDFPSCIIFPIAWTLGTVVPMLVLVAFLGPPGYVYMNRMAHTQLALPLVQVADLAGMPGIEFLMAAVAGAIVDKRIRSLATCAIVIAAVCTYAQIRTGEIDSSDRVIRVALFQVCEAPAKAIRADLFVWPEGNRWQQWPEEKWMRFAEKLGGIAVVGASRADGSNDYNSVIVATRDRVRFVDKRFLVMGSETPSPVDWLTGEPGRNQLFAIGDPPGPCQCDGISLSLCICNEITIPRLSTTDTAVIVNPGSERRIACANGPAMMLNQARLRAIESRRPVVRAVLGGHTAIIDGNGRVVKSTTDSPLVGDVPFDARLSLYSALGDWVTPLCAVAAVVLYRRRRRDA